MVLNEGRIFIPFNVLQVLFVHFPPCPPLASSTVTTEQLPHVTVLLWQPNSIITTGPRNASCGGQQTETDRVHEMCPFSGLRYVVVRYQIICGKRKKPSYREREILITKSGSKARKGAKRGVQEMINIQ